MAMAALICIAVASSAQEQLQIAEFFSQEFMQRSGTSGVTLSNKKLDKYGIRLYRSVSVTDDMEMSQKMEKAVKHDGKQASQREVIFREGRLHFGFYALPPQSGGKGLNRYMIYLDQNEEGKNKTTIIYLEGKAEPDKVQKFLNL